MARLFISGPLSRSIWASYVLPSQHSSHLCPGFLSEKLRLLVTVMAALTFHPSRPQCSKLRPIRPQKKSHYEVWMLPVINGKSRLYHQVLRGITAKEIGCLAQNLLFRTSLSWCLFVHEAHVFLHTYYLVCPSIFTLLQFNHYSASLLGIEHCT